MKKLKEGSIDGLDRLVGAAFDESFPVNPLPFLNGMKAIVKEHGTKGLESHEGRSLLWIVIAQVHGQLATVDLHHEWYELYKERKCDE